MQAALRNLPRYGQSRPVAPGGFKPFVHDVRSVHYQDAALTVKEVLCKQP